MTLVLCTCLAATALSGAWWDDFPGIIQTSDAAKAAASHASVVLSGSADDPCWGLYAQRTRLESSITGLARLRQSGLKNLSWFEGFGTCESYAAQLKRNAPETWSLQLTNPPLTRIFSHHWNWQDFDGSGEIRWIGLPNYYDDDDFARPWTRTHPRYGGPPMRYPDGRIATGYHGSSTDPRNSNVLDAGCSKDLLGRVTFEYEYNEIVNRLSPATKLPHGPLNGLVQVDDPPIGPPDPGFTPDEWKRIKKAGYSGVVSSGKDSACPIWIDYARASVQAALDAGVDGLWVDNYSPWDSFGGKPVSKAFGEWSVAGFRDYLRGQFTPSALEAMGVANPSIFDIRTYLCEKCREWKGDPSNLNDPRWLDPKWLADPVWRAYLIYKRQTGAAALSAYYRKIKETAAASGKPDFLVMGNDIPLYSLGWVRGDLDMVSTELTWGWHLTSGPRGFMAPPEGSYAPVYKLAREHARSRFVNAWLYGPDDQLGRTNIARVLYYQALANHALPMPNPGGRTVGNSAADSEFFAFLRRIAPLFQDRRAIEQAGIYYSSSSQLMEMTPGGFRDHNRQPHSFAFWGWGTALTQLHIPWRAIPEWKMNAETLSNLRFLVIPESQVFDPADLPPLADWVRSGGTLIVTGGSGALLGERDNFDKSPRNALAAFAGPPEKDAQNIKNIGQGRTLWLAEDPGIAFYQADSARAGMLGRFSEFTRLAGDAFALSAPEVSPKTGVVLYQGGGKLFADIHNTDIDLKTDTIKALPPLRFTVALPPEFQGKKLFVRAIGPGTDPEVKLEAVSQNRIGVKLGPLEVYASVIIEPAKD